MSLISCLECGRSISSKAPQCIHCGCPISEQRVESAVVGKSSTPIIPAVAPVPPQQAPAPPVLQDSEQRESVVNSKPITPPILAVTQVPPVEAIVPQPSAVTTLAVPHLAGIPFESIATYLQKEKEVSISQVRYLAQELDLSPSFFTRVRARYDGAVFHLVAMPKWRLYCLATILPWAMIRGIIESRGLSLGYIGTIVLLMLLFGVVRAFWGGMGFGDRAMRDIHKSLSSALKVREPIETEDRLLREAVARRHAALGIVKRPQA